MKLNVPVSISSEYSPSLSTGSSISLRAIFGETEVSQINPIILGSSSLGERGKRSEDVGRDAVFKLIKEIESNAPVDSHMTDQLLPFLAIVGGSMKVAELTPHCLTNIYTIEQFMGKCFKVDKENRVISCPPV